jgi:hypothetical protein
MLRATRTVGAGDEGGPTMGDDAVLDRIEGLVAEEERLLQSGEEQGGLQPEEHQRLEAVRVELDRCWDLLRQRRARAEAGLDPDATSVRDPETVEGYLQ